MTAINTAEIAALCPHESYREDMGRLIAEMQSGMLAREEFTRSGNRMAATVESQETTARNFYPPDVLDWLRVLPASETSGRLVFRDPALIECISDETADTRYYKWVGPQ